MVPDVVAVMFCVLVCNAVIFPFKEEVLLSKYNLVLASCGSNGIAESLNLYQFILDGTWTFIPEFVIDNLETEMNGPLSSVTENVLEFETLLIIIFNVDVALIFCVRDRYI